MDLQFTAILEESNNKLWGGHFQVPSVIAQSFEVAEGGNTRRVVCILNDTMEYQCAILPYGEGRFVITVNKKTQKQLNLHFGSTVSVALKPDESEYGLPMPEEFQEVLNQDPEGNAYFQALTDGKKRTFLYIIAQPKSSDLRIKRALTIVEHLKFFKGKIDYKKLGESMKGN